MKQNILFVLAFFCLGALVAQDMEFTVSPVIVNDVTTDMFEGVGHSTLVNTGTIDRTFRWDLSVVEMSDTWNVAFCDKNLCYGTDIITEQYTLMPDSAGRMDVHVYPNAREGYAIIEITNTDLADENQQVSNLYYFNADPTGTVEAFRQTIKVYPNPSNGLFSVKGEKGIARIEVFSLAGNKVKTFTYGDGQWYDISDLPRGTYLVRLVDRDAQQLVTKLINKL